jgi:hypothetical protein
MKNPHLLWLLVCLLLSGCKKNITDSATPPVISVASPTVSGTVNNKTTLEASATGGQGTLTYAWAIKTAPTGSTATLGNATTPKAELTPDKPGTYLIGLTVADASGQKTTTELKVTASLPGKPPVISVATSMTAEIGKQTAIDGSKSSDPDGDKLTYAWAIKTKPTSSTATLTKAQEAIAGFMPDVAGTYVVSLSISDGIWPAVSAEVSITATAPVVRVVNGNWTTASGTSAGIEFSPRNKFYSFDVATNNQPVSLTITSADVNVGIALYDPLGVKIDGFGTARSLTVDKVVNAGTYSVMAYTGQRYDVGTFRLAGRGIASEFTLKPTSRVQAANASFGAEGGGGGFSNRVPVSPRNHYYTFDVTDDNTVTDITVASADIALWMNLRSPAGAQVTNTAGTVNGPRHFVEKLNKGTYGLYVASDKRDAIGKYSLDIFGKVENLKQAEVNSTIQADSYAGRNATVTYNLTVTEDNSTLDASLRSPDITGTLEILKPDGSRLDYTVVASNYDYLVSVVNKGVYKLVVKPGLGTSGIGKYTLSVYGKFSELKKQ